ncbi:MAG: BatD family protein [Planctomycetota bacterium]|nr:BatD family protein [Planctomycetota bacterium]
MNLRYVMLSCAFLCLQVTAWPGGPPVDPPGAFVAPDISVELSPDRPEVGLVMAMVVTVSGAEGADCDLLDVPEIDGARLTFRGTPSTQKIEVGIDGRVRSSLTTRWQFELVPERAGELVLPPIRFNCRGTELETAAQRISVASSSLREGLVSLSVRPSVQELWVGQVVEMDVAASIHPDAEKRIPRGGLELSLPWLSGVPGLHPRDIPNPSCRSVFPMPVNGGRAEVPLCQVREVVSGGMRLVLRTRIPMLATEAGLVTLPDSRFSVRLVMESRRERDPFFGGMLNRSSVVPTRVLIADAFAEGAKITVNPTPIEGRPDSFTNAVGRFNLVGSAGPTSLSVGESCNLKLSLRADGQDGTNLDLVEWPAFEEQLEDFRLFGKDESKGPNTRILSFELSPKNAGVTEIPELEFGFFDTSSGTYETRSVGPFPLDVTPGGGGGLTELTVPEEVLNDLESIRTQLPPPQSSRWPAWGPPAGALILLGLIELRRRSRDWKKHNPRKVVRRGARSVLEKSLRDATGPAAVAAAFSRYLAERLDGPAGGLTANEAAGLLPDRALGEELVRVVSGWEAAYLGGATLDLNGVRAEARSLADQLEAVT